MKGEHQSTVCVLGFGRSGTSLTMQVLKTLGVEIGADEDLLVPQEADNARGYWEPSWMVELNDEILAALGTTWWKPFRGSLGWAEAPELAQLRARAKQLFEEKLGGAAVTGWKDPRTTLTLPLWRQVVPEPLYVICLRSPVDAIASIQRRPEPTLSVREWSELWLEYTARALQETAGKRRLLVFYGDYFDDPEAQIRRLASLLDLSPDDERIVEATTLIEADLRHHRSSAIELAASPGLTASARMAFLALRCAHEVRYGGSASDNELALCDAIERAVVAVWEEGRLAADAQQIVEREAGEAADLRTRLENEQRDAAGLAQALEELRAELQRRDGELAALRSSLSWRATAPLRASKRHAQRLGAARRATR